MKEVRVNVRLDKPLGDKVRDDAAKEERTMSGFIRHIIAQYYSETRTQRSVGNQGGRR